MAEGRRRVFVALWPGAAATEALHALSGVARQACGGRRMRPDTLHLTLAFIGETPEARLPALRAALASVRAGDFRFTLDRLGHWRHNRVLWAGCSSPSPQLAALAEAVRAALAAADFRVADHGAFVPHVTLLRKAAPVAGLPAMAPVEWPVTEFVLVASALSADGARYVRLGAWPLT